MATRKKRKATKSVLGTVPGDYWPWSVKYGDLRRGRGRPGGIAHLFKVVAEKSPFGSLGAVKSHLRELGLPSTGVYVAHDSMGAARYVGRGNIFVRLESHKKAHDLELVYYSFYVVVEKNHEREIETLLIRAAGPLLHFNERKKRVDIEAGSVTDFEPGTLFYERQRRRGRAPGPSRRGRRSSRSGRA